MEFNWFKFNDEGAKDAFIIREKVYCDGLGFSRENEIDEHDEKSLHLVVSEDGVPVACSRVYPESLGVWHFGRLRRLEEYGGKSYGQRALLASIEKCREMGAYKIILGALYAKKGIYEAQGFSTYGEIFYDEEVPHIMMKKEFPIENGFVWCESEDKAAQDSFELRKKIFCDEVGFDEKSAFDGKDKDAKHLVLYAENKAVCAVRVLKHTEDSWYFGMLCSPDSARGKGYGKKQYRKSHAEQKKKE